MARTVPGYSRRPRRDWGQLLARLLCLIFGVIGAVPLGVGALVRTPYVQSWAARETAAVLERELGLFASYRVEVHAWPLSVGLSDVVVEGSDALGAALEVARILVRPRLFALLGGRVDAGHIEIDAPRVRVVVRDGVVQNLRYRLPDTGDRPPSRRAPFTSLAVTDAALDVDIEGVRVKGRDVDVDVTTEDGPRFEVILKTGEQSIVREHAVLSVDPVPEGQTAVDEDVLCQLDARVRFSAGSVLVHRLALSGFADNDGRPGTAPPCQAAADDPRRIELGLRQAQATSNGAGKPELDGSVHARIPLGLVNRFIPFPSVHGYVALDLEGHYGKTNALPELRGKISGAGLGLDRYHLISELAGDITVDDDAIHSDHLSVGFAEGTLLLKNIVVEPLKKGSPVRVGVIDAANVRFPAMMRDLDVTPHAHVNWVYKATHVTGLEGTLAPLRLDGEFSGITTDFEVFDKAVDDPARRHMIGVKEAHVAGHAAIRPDAVVFRNSRIDFGDSHIDATVSLGFDNDLGLTIAPTTKIDLANVSPLASLTLAGKATLSGEMKGKFNDPMLIGDLAVAGFSLQDFPLGDITSSKVRFHPLTVDFSDLHAKKGKSIFDVATARLDFNGPATLIATASVDAADLFVRDFMHMWHFDTDPRFDSIDGHGRTKATLRYDLGGQGDPCGGGALAIRGAVHMASMDLFEEHYDALDSEFNYRWVDRDAADLGLDVDIRSITLKKGRGTLFGSGTIRRGGLVRAELVADDIPLSHIQAMGPVAKMLDGTASAVGTVSGTIDELEADVDVRMSPLRVGNSMLPASKFHLGLSPVKKNARVVAHTRCGQPMTPAFDRAEFDRDAAMGVFHVTGQLFDRQIAFQDFKITRQRHKTISGAVAFDKLELAALGSLRSPKPGTEPVTKEALAGSLSASLAIASLPLDAPERMSATLALKALALHTGSGKLELKSAPPPLTIGEDRLTLPPIDFEFSAGNGFRALVTTSGDMRRLSSSPEVNLSAKVAPMTLSSLASLLPRVERASGTLDASLNVTGKLAAPAYAGEVHLRDGELALRGFPMPLSQMNVDLSIADGEVRVIHGASNVGGGTVSIGGHAPIRGFKLGQVSGFVTAKGVSVPVIDGISMTCDADLRAEWDEAEDEEAALPRLSGEVILTSFSYTRPIAIGAADIGAIAQRGRRKTFDAYDPADDMMTFDVQLKSRDPLRLRNNLIDAQLMVDSDALVFAGTNQRFGLRGRLRLLTGGRIRLRANEFEIRQGYVQFDDTTRIAPHVDVTAVTEYRRYSGGGTAGSSSGAAAAAGGRAGGVWRITLHAFGDADNLRLDMTSEPALSQEDIVLLLTVGMTRAEVDQMAASVGGTAALEALSSLTGADSAVKKAVPVIDDFRFGSAYSSRTGRSEATVTVGKRVTDQVRANVTSGLLENREIRSNLEWKLTPRVSVQGSYDNVNDVSSSSFGNLGADVRWRLEFE
ncbi:MAG TPA: translocation/assembly module TamB domain-containing protein [Polyangiaceae bacterium]|nr:translocation/assembly module TamB domain-containing protein [Polyangiaceae bacterium]